MSGFVIAVYVVMAGCVGVLVEGKHYGGAVTGAMLALGWLAEEIIRIWRRP